MSKQLEIMEDIENALIKARVFYIGQLNQTGDTSWLKMKMEVEIAQEKLKQLRMAVNASDASDHLSQKERENLGI